MLMTISSQDRRDGGFCRSITAALILVLATFNAAASCLQEAPLRGVNLAGAEFNTRELPGIMHQNYTYPAESDFQYFGAKGASTIRLPVRWERVQQELFGPLDGANLHEIRKSLNSAVGQDQCLILDLHNYGYYSGEKIGTDDVPVAAFVDVWRRLAEELGNPEHLALGLMNEPFNHPIDEWAAMAQHTVNELREAGVDHLIMVSGGRWSGVHEWFRRISGVSNAQAFARFTDPLDRTVLEVHQYVNEGYSGTREDCLAPEHFDGMFAAISAWAREHDQRLFLGEFGAPGSSECLVTLDHLLAQVNDPLIWRGWAYWSAGRWWGDYFLSVHPRDGKDAEQMAVLEPYFTDWNCEQVPDGRCPRSPQDLEVEHEASGPESAGDD